VPWSKPEDLSTVNGIGSKHPGGFNAAMGDGSVRFIKSWPNNPISPTVLRALFTRNGAEQVNVPD
jgi:prepilin-type processing-associated H-X9-DG protein